MKGQTKETVEYLDFLKDYSKSRIIKMNSFSNTIKNGFVNLLLLNRGKYSSSILNTTFFLVTGAVVIVTPNIAKNTFVSSFYGNINQIDEVSLDVNEFELGNIISEKPPDRIIEYQVQKGEKLSDIVGPQGKFKYTSINSVKWLNNIKADNLKEGTIVKIPPIDGIVHTVSPGETIYSIAKKYNINAQSIINYPYNDFADQETYQLAQNQILYIPGGIYGNSNSGLLENLAYKTTSIQNTPIVGGTKGSGNFLWPTDGIVTQYPIWYHMAFDIARSIGTPVKAADSGTVSYSDCIATGYGCHIIIDHGNSFTTLYAHLSKRNVQVGENVSKGQEIGLMGSTGRSTGPHLHFEIRINGKTQNPADYFK